MANPEHVAILKQGVEVWNSWRKLDTTVRPDLASARLQGFDLHTADLGGANLVMATLTGANLQKANLTSAALGAANLSDALLCEANLASASLRQAKLFRADLRWANMGGADLSWADLREARLNSARLTHGVDFTRASLRGADMADAIVSLAVFAEVNLANVKGLNDVVHSGPSIISIGTFYRSEGQIPDAFLRGAGVPDSLITFQRSLLNSSIDFYSCFMSYSSTDQGIADRLYADMQTAGVRSWLATENLKIGDSFRERIDESIRLHDKLLLILSEHSVNSRWVQDEVEAALEREHREGRSVLFPIRIDDAVMETDQAWAASIRRTRHIGDFTQWKLSSIIRPGPLRSSNLAHP